MRKILYYTRDKRYKDDFKPVYAEAPWYLWVLHYTFNTIGGWGFHMGGIIEDKIKNK